MKNGAYGFGIIGLGAIADVHAKAIATLDDGVLVACFDMVPGKAEKFCEGHGGKPYGKLEEFLQDPELDIVTVTTPSGAHLEVALAALRAKKTVIVEKLDNDVTDNSAGPLRNSFHFPSHSGPNLSLIVACQTQYILIKKDDAEQVSDR